MSSIFRCLYDIFVLSSDKQSGGAIKVVQKQHKKHFEEEQEQQPPKESKNVSVENDVSKQLTESGDSIQNEGQTEKEAKLGPSSDIYKMSEPPVHTEDANTKQEVPSVVATPQNEVRFIVFLSGHSILI